MMPGRLERILEHGLWALLFCMLGMTIFFIIIDFQKLPYLVENFQGDSYDTILSVKFLMGYGLFGDVPLYSGPYSLFGNFPVLYAMLASVPDMFLNDPSLCVAMLYWLIEIAIAILVCFVFLKDSDWKVRTLFVLVMLVDAAFGNLFPLGYRKRQQLAILLGMTLFLTKNPMLEGVIAFLSLLAQPVVGAGMIALKAADSFEKRKFPDAVIRTIPLMLSFVFAYPFYSNLLQQMHLAPLSPTYVYITGQELGPSEVLFLLAASSFFICNLKNIIKKTDLVGIISAGMVLIYPVGLALFFAMKDSAPEWFINPFLMAVSTCFAGLFNIAAFGMILMVFHKKAEIPKITIFLLLLLCIANLWIEGSIIYKSAVVSDSNDYLLDKLDSLGMSKIKTSSVYPIEYSGAIHMKSQFTVFQLQGYALLHGRDISFVDEFDLPPDLSKGKTNIPTAAIPQAIYDGDSEGCKQLVGELRGSGVQGILYVISQDLTSSGEEWAGRFTDKRSLDGCGIHLAYNSTGRSNLMVLYDIR